MTLRNVAFAWMLCVLFAGCTSAQVRDSDLLYTALQPRQKSLHPPVIILMHGYGSNEQDLLGIKDFLPARFLIISARAPYTIEHGKYKWYDPTRTDGFREGSQPELAHSTQAVLQLIYNIIKKYNADAAKVYLIGFSQGAIMSYCVSLSNPAKIKGIAPLSGMLYKSVRSKILLNDAAKNLRIFASSGTADKIIPYADSKESTEYLASIGLHPEFHSYEGMGHSISEEVLRDLNAWLEAEK
jgi:phospholipase/carboxylesterase